MDLRTAAAVTVAKIARRGLTAFGRGGTALPGILALAVDPSLVANLASGLQRGTVLVSGTNGKTTTSRILADIARGAGLSPVHNRSGSNLDRGIAAALVGAAGPTGSVSGDIGIFEVDEASVPRVLARVVPSAVLITNLFRDQLDRYFEIDQLARRIGGSLATLPPTTTLVLNADDPIVAGLAKGHAGRTLYFGVDDASVGGQLAQSISDAPLCPRCSTRLAYRRVVLAHVGDWACPACGLERPARDLAATAVSLSANGSRVEVRSPEETVTVEVPIPGLYNVYNALAALAAARAIGLDLAEAARTIASFRPAFGRLEVVEAEGRRLRLVLVKNPAGFNAAISAILEGGAKHRILAALNDRDADGRDVSWIWDADFEALVPLVDHATVTGIRGRDLALRFKYAGLERDRMTVVDGWERSIRSALLSAASGEEVVVLATYTAMLALRAALARMGHVRMFWED